MSPLPPRGLPWPALEAEMRERRAGDIDWRRGRMHVYVHYAGEDVLAVAREAYGMFIAENAAAPAAFPSIARFEQELLSMILALLHAPEAAQGTLTTGGTESIFLAMKSARDWAAATRGARRGGVAEVIVPDSAHPAVEKAARYLGLRVTRVAVGDDLRAAPDAIARAIGPDTIMLFGSAPSFPFGSIDPIGALGALALERGLWLHVDACVGGFIAPFARLAGHAVPDFDFSIPGVCSMSADAHKYGYAPKGLSAVMYASPELARYQTFAAADLWQRGPYRTEGLAGTRSGGVIAAAWAVMRYLGVEGYVELTARVIELRQAIERGVQALGFTVVGKPELGIVAFSSAEVDVELVAGGMRHRGWYSGTLVRPRAIHLMLTPAQCPVVSEYLDDLAEVVQEVKAGRAHAPIVAGY